MNICMLEFEFTVTDSCLPLLFLLTLIYLISLLSSVGPELTEKLRALISIHGPLPQKPRPHIGPPNTLGGLQSPVSSHQCQAQPKSTYPLCV